MAARVRLRDAGATLRTLTQIRARDAGGALRTITRIRARDAANVLRVVYDTTGASSFSASANSGGSVAGRGNTTATTAAVTVTPTGGIAPYFHAWTLVSHTNGTNPTINSPAAGTTTFTQTNIGAGDFDSAIFKDTVSDSAIPPNSTTVNVRGTFVDISTV